ncbi:MBL fold metallo-hydrolase [Xanthomonas campestris pv. zingibericola]|uniref:MBL fold metallo-hydrolase n=1 Tax=Xanthomonas TaxID=338 RepID=UPI0004DF3BA5|nr:MULTISPECIES: MBL fold metallo-hydrolase [Xanthomonas]MBO9793587.1 MBL fold metallo-hydrolase [Xanthomonas phaseoli pv. dieffenbachiae]MBO9849058.1 MBL fold metallo-hydrolase [Xanthomonas phaseoli pv. dieffenbachiae]MBV6858464.1 MBL fold metallo-hydrolase [Xanthomonas campestris pv. zingibericola]OQP37688.1 MBL fold metallo-hydrolase [Xanthomonas euvesicatoria]
MQPQVLAFFHADSNTFTYVVADAATGAAAVIDPALDYAADSGVVGSQSAQAILAAIEQHGWQVQWLLETHAHADHLSAAQWLKQHWPQARIGIGEGICKVQRTLAAQYALPADFRADGSQFDHLFADDERFKLGGIEARVIAVPGHTSDSIAYLIGDALFPGDSLFMPDAGTARCDFPGGDARQLFASIQRLYALPESTRVFVCHDYGPGGRAVAHQTSIGAQRRSNIHVRDGVDVETFVAQRQARDATLPEPKLIRPALQTNLQAGRCAGVVL